MENYQSEVEDLALAILEELNIKTQEQFEENRDSIYEATSETVEASLAYTHDIYTCLQETSNRNAYNDVCLDLSGTQDFNEIASQVAFYAKHADVEQELVNLFNNLPTEDELLEDSEENEIEA